MFGVISESSLTYACMILSPSSFHAFFSPDRPNTRHQESRSDHDTARGGGGGIQPSKQVGIRPSKLLKIHDGNVPSHITMGYMSLQRLVYYNHHTLRPYSESLQTRPAILYIPCATSFHEQTGDIITFSQFEEGGLLENKRDLVEDK